MLNRRTVILSSALGGLAALGVSASAAATQTATAGAGGAAAPPVPAPEIAAELPTAVWSGSARMRYFTFNIYDATLWVAPGFAASRYTQTPFALQLNYLRSLDGNAIAERSLVEMRRGASITPEQEKQWLAAMQASFPDVKAGDRITGLHQPGVGARFWFNGTARPPIADAEFSRLFFGIWLADFTSEPRMRTSILAGAAP